MARKSIPPGELSGLQSRSRSRGAVKGAAANAARGAARLSEEGVPARSHPATSDRVYTADELEFLQAVEAFKVRTGRRFPSLCELLDVLKSLGYRKPENET